MDSKGIIARLVQAKSVSCLLLAVMGIAVFGLYMKSKMPTTPARIKITGEGLRDHHFARFRNSPYKPKPILIDGIPVSDEDVRISLRESLPIFRPPHIALLIHEARLWGEGKKFGGELCRHRNSDEIFQLLMNGEKCRDRVLGSDAPYLSESPFGVHVSMMGTEGSVDDRAESHYGQLAACFGFAGIESSRQIVSDCGTVHNVRDLLADSALGFTDDHEIEFFLLAMGMYLETPCIWIDSSGEQKNVSMLLRKLVSRKIGDGTCLGTHAPYVVAFLLRRDIEDRILDESTRQLSIDYLKKISLILSAKQDSTGGWSQWVKRDSPVELHGGPLVTRISVTAHHLEWISIACPEWRPRVNVIFGAARSLTNDIRELPPPNRRLFKNQLPITHAARALLSLRDAI